MEFRLTDGIVGRIADTAEQRSAKHGMLFDSSIRERAPTTTSPFLERRTSE